MASALAISTRCWAATGRLPARRDGSDVEPDALQQLARLAALRAARDQPEPRRSRARAPCSRRSLRWGSQRELLVDHRDAELLRVLRAVEADALAVAARSRPRPGARPARAASSASTCRRRSRPAMAWTSPARKSRSTPSTAVTPGKRFVIARSRTTTSPACLSRPAASTPRDRYPLARSLIRRMDASMGDHLIVLHSAVRACAGLQPPRRSLDPDGRLVDGARHGARSRGHRAADAPPRDARGGDRGGRSSRSAPRGCPRASAARRARRARTTSTTGSA